jgi:hypothetical protein
MAIGLYYRFDQISITNVADRYFTALTHAAQTAYAQLLDGALSAEHLRSVADLPGSFASKTVKGYKYWYFQYTEPSGKLRQVFVGPEGRALQKLMSRKGEASARQPLAPLSRSAMALGCAGVLPRHFRVVRRLADYGFFEAGGVLVGTHAFLASGNMLGVRWGSADRTQDLDFAHAGRSIALVLPGDVEVQTGDAIQSLGMGFLPVTGLSSKAAAGYLNPKEPEFRLDFLTTRHRGREEPFEHSQLHVTMQPLKFMEFSLENVQQSVLFCAEGAVLVNVPHPARYALHKLLVFGERQGTFSIKSGKDLTQAAAILACLEPHRAGEVMEAWRDLLSRGPGWVSRARQGLEALGAAHPDLAIQEWLPLPAAAPKSARSAGNRTR